MVIKKPKAEWKKAIMPTAKGWLHWILAIYFGFELAIYVISKEHPEHATFTIIDGLQSLIVDFGGWSVAVPLFIALYEVFRPRKEV